MRLLRCCVYCRALSCWSPEDGPRHVKVILEWKSYCADRCLVCFLCYLIFLLIVLQNVVCLLSVLWHCWFGIRKSIRPVKKWVMRCLRGYVSGVRCIWFVYSSADATATTSFIASLKSRLVWPFWCRLTKFVLEQRPLNRCLLSVCP